MSDPSFSEFYTRIDRIEKARARGFGFEAAGTLGRSFYTRKARRIRLGFPLLRQTIALLIAGVVIKAMFLHQLGADVYGARVEKLRGGEMIDVIGAWLMQPDPVTVALATQLGNLLRALG